MMEIDNMGWAPEWSEEKWGRFRSYPHASPYQVSNGVRRGTITRSISPSNSARTWVRSASYPNEIRLSK